MRQSTLIYEICVLVNICFGSIWKTYEKQITYHIFTKVFLTTLFGTVFLYDDRNEMIFNFCKGPTCQEEEYRWGRLGLMRYQNFTRDEMDEKEKNLNHIEIDIMMILYRECDKTNSKINLMYNILRNKRTDSILFWSRTKSRILSWESHVGTYLRSQRSIKMKRLLFKSSSWLSS